MDTNKINMSMVYNTVANMLPTEGRDFVINTDKDADNNQRLVIKPLTPLGKDWVPHLQAQLMKNGAVNTVTGDAKPVNQEHETIVQMIKRLTDEADAKRATRIAELRREHERKAAAIKELQKQVKAGDPEPADLRGEINKLKALHSAWVSAVKVSKAVPDVRRRVEAAAETAAKEDASRGVMWAVSPDEEVKTLFDKQDITRKISDKATLIEEVARLEVAANDKFRKAVDIAKQYTINKPAEKGAN